MLVAATVMTFGPFSQTQSQSFDAADEEVLNANSAYDYELSFVCPNSLTGTISLPYPYFYVSSEITYAYPHGSVSDISVQADLMSTNPIRISYIGPMIMSTVGSYTVRIAAGVDGYLTAGEFRRLFSGRCIRSDGHRQTPMPAGERNRSSFRKI